MKKIILCFFVSTICLVSFPATATNDTHIFATCLTDSLNGKERKLLAKWIFAAMAAHPEIIELSSVSADTKNQIDQSVGILITRLLTLDCREELVGALAQDPLAIENAFRVVGEVAMVELYSDKSVTSSLTNYIQYVDMKAVNSIMSN
jgi:hypothetical protein